ncbi:hypothetical protein [Sphingomonas turrisvirgatae]|uniref:Uncharacterized protein n=1 Tax=Sphingomonas turrisvirgatae TaxID=1888892 RepID=A0A1E3LUV9_9SPHN|nr:hypothetical protein [Sphingomonas turrisvirgatae]ODP37557.1 hypothetical protein BFL28_17380 [Sphingomonas turrisvirgatae]
MPVLLSGTIAVALSSAAAGQSPEVPALATAAPAAEPEPAPELAPSAGGYVIVDIPAFNRGAAPLPPTEGAEEVGAADHETAALAPVDQAFDAAVVAAHDERIQLIRQRIELVEADAGSETMLSDLERRLAKAQAARDKAAARMETLAVATIPSEPQLAATEAPSPLPPPPRIAAHVATRKATRVAVAAPTAMEPAKPVPEAQPTADPLHRSRIHLAAAREALDVERAVAGPLRPSLATASERPDADPLGWLSPEPADRIAVALAALLAAVALAGATRPRLPDLDDFNRAPAMSG